MCVCVCPFWMASRIVCEVLCRYVCVLPATTAFMHVLFDQTETKESKDLSLRYRATHTVCVREKERVIFGYTLHTFFFISQLSIVCTAARRRGGRCRVV